MTNTNLSRYRQIPWEKQSNNLYLVIFVFIYENDGYWEIGVASWS